MQRQSGREAPVMLRIAFRHALESVGHEDASSYYTCRARGTARDLVLQLQPQPQMEVPAILAETLTPSFPSKLCFST